MYLCNCKSKNEITTHITVVDRDKICINCGYYAQWVNPNDVIADDGDCVYKKVTVFKLATEEFKHFDNLKDASKWSGYKSETSLSRGLGATGKFFYSNPKRIAVCLGYVETIPRELKELIDTHLAYCYSYSTGELVAKGTYDQLAKVMKIPKASIVSSIHRGHVNRKTNCVFTKRKDFDINTFKSTQKKGVGDFKIGRTSPVLHSEFTKYTEKELGVKSEEDHYGTWKEFLYS